MSKSITAYKTISEVVAIVGLKSKTSQSLPTHTIRFWETKFKQIKPKILNGNRRYYDEKSIEIIKKIHFLLKVKGMTINGVKKLLDEKNSLNRDETINQSIKLSRIKNKLVKISNILKDLKQ